MTTEPQTGLDRRARELYWAGTRRPEPHQLEGRLAKLRTIYCRDYYQYRCFCEERRVDGMPTSAEVLLGYVRWLFAEGSSVATVRRRVSALSALHLAYGLEWPRERSRDKLPDAIDAEIEQREPVIACGVLPLLRTAVAKPTGDDPVRCRDRAMLLLMAVAGLSCPDLGHLAFKDIYRARGGYWCAVVSRGSAVITHQFFAQAESDVCPKDALFKWLDVARIDEGLLFRTVALDGTLGQPLDIKTIARIIKDQLDDREHSAALDLRRLASAHWQFIPPGYIQMFRMASFRKAQAEHAARWLALQ
jgi:integrase